MKEEKDKIEKELGEVTEKLQLLTAEKVVVIVFVTPK